MNIYKRAWRRRYEATATLEQLDALYKADMERHNPDDPYCICDDCMTQVAADDLAKLNAPLEAA